jgi:hypothetical protein
MTMQSQNEYLHQYASVLKAALPPITEVGTYAPMYSDRDLEEQVRTLSKRVLPIAMLTWFPNERDKNRANIFKLLVHEAINAVIQHRREERDNIRNRVEGAAHVNNQ